jgi:hypothetical protein
MFGKLEFSRTALLPSTKVDSQKLTVFSNKKVVFPLDEVFGLDILPFKASISAMLEMAYWVQAVPSYEAAEKALKRYTAINSDADTIRAVANHIGKLVFSHDQQRANETWDLLESGLLDFPELKMPYDFYILIDGAMIHIRKKREKINSSADDIDDNKKSNWMENKLGMVCSSETFIKWKDKKGNIHKTIGQREYVAYIGSVEEFKKHLFATAIRHGYGKYKQTILLSDGATWIRRMKEELFPDSQQILDFFHLCENVCNFAKSVFDNKESEYKPWSERMCELLRASKYKEVLKEINKFGTHRLSKIDFNLANYIENNKDNIDYSTYEAKGWFIGSGAIESANRTVLQQRLKQPGMRWNLESGQYILTLMSKAKSNLWDEDVIKFIRRIYGTDRFEKLLGYQ